MQELNHAATYPAMLLSVDAGCTFDDFEQKLHRALRGANWRHHVHRRPRTPGSAFSQRDRIRYQSKWGIATFRPMRGSARGQGEGSNNE